MIVNSTNRPQQVANAERVAGSNSPDNRTVPDDGGIRANLSPNIPRMSIRSRAARTATRSERNGLFRILGSCFGGRPRSNQRISSSGNVAAHAGVVLEGKANMLLTACITGMSTARENAAVGLADSKSSDEVATFFTLGDKAIRRGTTAIHNLAHNVSFDGLSDAEKQKMPAESLENLKKQSAQIAQMANTISQSKFLDTTENFNQYGTGSGAYKEALEKHPDKDHTIRAWVQDGLNLGTELINIQEQVLGRGRVQSESYLGDLQSRVNVFAALEKAMPDPIDINVVGSFTDEVLEKTTEIK